MRRNGLPTVSALRCRCFLAVLPLGLVLAGCGGEVYEQRLANTRTLFAHEELLNQHLQGKWTDAEYGLGLRVPLKFEMLPPPAAPAATEKPPAQEGEETEEEAEIPDDRQPKYLNVELPGLRGAFLAQVKILAENNVDLTGDAWIYVMSNHDQADKPDVARDFNRNFVKALADALKKVPDEKEWRDEFHPPKRNPPTVFVTPLKYTTVTIDPEDDIAGFARQFSIYMYENGEVQVIVLFVLPKNVDSSEKFVERIPLCLETLDAAGNRLIPRAPGAAIGGGGAPSKESF